MKLNYTDQKKVTPQFKKIQVEQANCSFFFGGGECIIYEISRVKLKKNCPSFFWYDNN